MNLRKIFLAATTALVFTATGASADMPKVTVGGTIDARLSVTDQTKLYEEIADDGSELSTTSQNKMTHHRDEAKISTEAKLVIAAEGKADSGMMYGGEMALDIHSSPSSTVFYNYNSNEGGFFDSDATESDKTEAAYAGDMARVHHAMVYLESGMGRFEFGGTKSAALNLAVKTPTVKHADFDDFVNVEVGHTVGESGDESNGSEKARYLTSASLPGDIGTGQKYSNKVAYYTPKMGGMQAGVSYTPNTNNKGSYSGFTSKYNTASTTPSGQPDGLRNALSGVVTYEHQLDDALVSVSLAAVSAESKQDYNVTPEFRDVSAYEFGLNAKMDEFTLGTKYGYWAKSMNRKTLTTSAAQETEVNARNASKGHYWTVGAVYTNGPVALSADYFNSKLQGNKTRSYTLAGEYKVAEGFATYVDVNFFKLTPKSTGVYQLKSGSTVTTTGAAVKNDGTVLLVGTKFNF